MRKFIYIALFLFTTSLFSQAKGIAYFPVSRKVISVKTFSLSKHSIISDNSTPDKSPNTQKKKRIKGSSYEFLISFENKIEYVIRHDEHAFFFYDYYLLLKSLSNSKRGPPADFII